jgi:D-glycero-D-manno-heptose 1,7-bisphosphate phosphatase
MVMAADPAGRGNKAVFLDRDGVLVIPEFRDGRSYAPRSLEGYELYREAGPCLAQLKAAGFLLIVVTNQPDVGAGLVDQRDLDKMHDILREALCVDSIEVCTHTAEQRCFCRKPNPGMLLQAAERLGIDLARSFMVGDRASDAAAGAAAGCQTAFLDLAYAAEAPPDHVDFRATSLSTITNWILARDCAIGAPQ